MITDEGRVYEDVGGGQNRVGEYGATWWNENHPGVTAAGDLESDNVPLSGPGRHVRGNYNPLVQFQLVRHQARVSTVVSPPAERNNALVLADRAWRYAQKAGHDGRTLFASEELLAALELLHAGGRSVSLPRIGELAEAVLARQETRPARLSGYFMERDGTDAFRSVAFPAEPAMALLRLCELRLAGLEAPTGRACRAVESYVDGYLLADAASNPFGIVSYGVYVHPPMPRDQTFRDAGLGRFVRTFIHVFSEAPMPHGVNAGFLHQGYLMARAGKHLGRRDRQDGARRLLGWSTGHNPTGLCLFTDLGFKHPVPASFMNTKIPSAAVVGFLGRPEDTPYLETSNAVEWSTQEIWDVPFYYAIGLVSHLG